MIKDFFSKVSDDVGHVFEALLLSVPFFLSGSPVLAVIAVAYWFFGREIAQFERKEADRLGYGSILSLPPLAGWKFWKWDTDSKKDFFIPVFATIVVAIVLESFA